MKITNRNSIIHIRMNEVPKLIILETCSDTGKKIFEKNQPENFTPNAQFQLFLGGVPPE